MDQSGYGLAEIRCFEQAQYTEKIEFRHTMSSATGLVGSANRDRKFHVIHS